MKLSEIYDDADNAFFPEWMNSGNIVDAHTGAIMQLDYEEVMSQIEDLGNSVHLTNYTGEPAYAFNLRNKLTPPCPIESADVLAMGFGPFSNASEILPKEAPDQIEFMKVTNIPTEQIVNYLKSVEDVRIKFDSCTFVGSIANFMELNITDSNNFYLAGNTPNIDKLAALFDRAFDARMSAFEFQDLLIENGFEDLV